MKYEYIKETRVREKGMLRWINKMGLKGWEFFAHYKGDKSKAYPPVFHFRRKIKS